MVLCSEMYLMYMCEWKQQPNWKREAAAAQLHPEFHGCWVISASRSKIDEESVSLASPFIAVGLVSYKR